jgi:hypothetical protein
VSDDKQEAKSGAPPEVLALVRRALGPGLVLAGYRFIPVSFWFGVGLACFGFVICVFEVVYDPWVLSTSGKDWCW